MPPRRSSSVVKKNKRNIFSFSTAICCNTRLRIFENDVSLGGPLKIKHTHTYTNSPRGRVRVTNYTDTHTHTHAYTGNDNYCRDTCYDKFAEIHAPGLVYY